MRVGGKPLTSFDTRSGTSLQVKPHGESEMEKGRTIIWLFRFNEIFPYPGSHLFESTRLVSQRGACTKRLTAASSLDYLVRIVRRSRSLHEQPIGVDVSR